MDIENRVGVDQPYSTEQGHASVKLVRDHFEAGSSVHMTVVLFFQPLKRLDRVTVYAVYILSEAKY